MPGGVRGGFVARAWNTVVAGLLGCTVLLAHSALASDPPLEKKGKPKIDVCFVLDTTGSMSGLIEGAEQKIRIQKLNKEREDYLARERKRLADKGKSDSFDDKVAQTIRSHAARKGIEYEK